MSLQQQKLRLCRYIILIVISCLAPSSSAQSQQNENNENPVAGSITGRVLNEAGQPIAHASVFVNTPMMLSPPRTTSTDENGNFQVTGLGPLLYSVWASAPAYIAAPRESESVMPTTYRIGDSVSLNLVKGGVITGTVTAPNGEPLTQVSVRAIRIRDADGRPLSGRFPLERRTDDRGIYRIYGLPAGTYLVLAGGRGTYGYPNNPFESDSPTYAPSATRDTAAEIAVRTGEETSGVDIRYRGEPGHSISGMIIGPAPGNTRVNITLVQLFSGVSQLAGVGFQSPYTNGFSLYGIADGDYELAAQFFSDQGEAMVSEPLRLSVKGADVTGVNVVLKALATLTGHVVLENSTAAECKDKRKPLLSETLLVARRSEKSTPNNLLTFPNFSAAQASPDKSGDFLLRNLAVGQFSLQARFFAKYWYLRSIEREIPRAPLRGAATTRQNDVARNGIALKFGDRINGLRVTLAAGAASLRGSLKMGEAEIVPPKLYLYLVPADKENADDVLRFFSTPVQADKTFALSNLPPGRYWALVRLSGQNEPPLDATLRAPEAADARIEIRRAAEARKTEIELKPCQNVVDYILPFSLLPGK
ncbi:MAG TPA: carboxypeptidase-like regulatory domain-containing protein [Pyrinomonadaceae bacterium]|nr:carboxypeptidase-like regulatory domain-containing protein [Pyrinomonadaceae bacterium]